MHADLLQSLGGLGEDHEGGVIALAVGGDQGLALDGVVSGIHTTLGVGDDLAVLDLAAGGLEEAQGSLQGGLILLLVVHVGGIDVLTLSIHRESDLVARIGSLRSSPRGVGDGVVDDGSALAIVGLDGDGAVSSQNGGESLTISLGGIGAGLIVDVHGVGAHADVTIAQVIHGIGGDGGAVDIVVLVGSLDGVHGGGAEGRIGDIHGAGDDAVQLIVFLSLQEVDILGLGGAQIVGIVSLEVNGTILELQELVGASTHGGGGLGTDGAQIALVKAELVVLVVVLGLVAIVVHGGDGHTQLIDGGGVDLGQGDGHAVVAGLLDAGDVGSGGAGLDTLGVLGLVVVQQAGEGGAFGLLSVDSLGQGGILGDDGVEGISLGSIGGQLEAPVGHAGGNGIALGVSALGNAVLHDGLDELHAGLIHVSPEGSLIRLFPLGEVGVVAAGSQHQVVQGVHTGTVSIHALDGQSKQGAVAVVGRIAQDVHGEDDVIDGDRLAVGELQVLAQLEVVVHSAIGVLHDLAVSGTIVGVVGAIVGLGFAFDTLHDDGALAIAVQQADSGHDPDVLVISGLGEEGGEFAVERGITHDQRGVAVLLAFVAAANEQAQAHDSAKYQSQNTGSFLHWNPP